MSVSKEEVKKIAVLARLEFGDDEVEALAKDMSRILEFAESIQEIDTEGVAPTTHSVEITDVLRDDVVKESLDRETVLAQAPDADDECFGAPKIV